MFNEKNKSQKLPYAVCWFPFEDDERVDSAIQIMKDLKISEVRTAFSWADWDRPRGTEWFDYFIDKLRKAKIRIMPCLFYTPLPLARTIQGQEPKTSSPPKELVEYSDFVGAMIHHYGDTFEWIQLWNEPNWQVYWDQTADPESKLFAQMIEYAIPVCNDAQKKIVLGGLSPYEPAWVERMFEYGIMQQIQALGFHAFPYTWPGENESRRNGRPWKSLEAEIEDCRLQLRKHNSNAEVWLTEVGHSTSGTGKTREENLQKQIEMFNEVLSCSAERSYWYTLLDLPFKIQNDNTINHNMRFDERLYNFGLISVYGNKKPLYEYWKKLADQTSN